MKKLLLSLALAFVGLCANAQFIFVDKDGNEIKDGSVVIVTELEEAPFDGVLMPSGLFIKNVTDNTANASMRLNITRMDNGSILHCFAGTCAPYSVTGEITPNGSAPIVSMGFVSINSEWIPKSEGLCTVAYTVKAGLIDCSTVTVHYCNGVYPANISSLLGNNDAKGYNLQGQIVDNNYRGVVIRNGKKYIQ